MRLLVLGGTAFLGARFVEAALDRGHTVTLFSRGQTKADRFGNRVQSIVGDRDPDKDAGLAHLAEHLKTASFDAVVDLSGYLPRHVRATAELLKDRVDTYLFISSVSVYAAPIPKGVDESGTLIRLDDPTVEEITPATYGGLKVVCEELVRALQGDAPLLVRPGIIGGGEDWTHRLTYWPWLATKCLGQALVGPGDAHDITEVIDARDLAAWMVRALEEGARGLRQRTGHDVFNTAGLPTTLDALLKACIDAGMQVSGVPAEERPEVTWVAAETLTLHNVTPFQDLPLWMPRTNERSGLLTADSSRALRAGLTLRPLVETAANALADFLNAGVPKPTTGLDVERMRTLLRELANAPLN